MPYRDAIETVLRRCDELVVRLEYLQRALHLQPGTRRECLTIDEALAAERELHAQLALLERRYADARAQAGVDAEDGLVAQVAMTAEESVAPSVAASGGAPRPLVVNALIAPFALVPMVLAASVFANLSRDRQSKVIYRGTVMTAPSTIAQTGGDCEATIRFASRGAPSRPCSVRVQCGAWERSFEETICDISDGELSRAHADEGLDLDTTTHWLSFAGSIGPEPASVLVRLGVDDAGRTAR